MPKVAQKTATRTTEPPPSEIAAAEGDGIPKSWAELPGFEAALPLVLFSRKLAEVGASMALKHAKRRPLPKKRTDERELRWIIDVAVRCVGKGRVVITNGQVNYGYYTTTTKTITLSRECLDSDEAAFVLAHEMGHWTWGELLGFPQHEVSTLVSERFANDFAEAILGRPHTDSRFHAPPVPALIARQNKMLLRSFFESPLWKPKAVTP